jgi:hypothetical protein
VPTGKLLSIFHIGIRIFLSVLAHTGEFEFPVVHILRSPVATIPAPLFIKTRQKYKTMLKVKGEGNQVANELALLARRTSHLDG